MRLGSTGACLVCCQVCLCCCSALAALCVPQIEVLAYRQGKQYDVIFVDQVSVVIPVLRMLTSSKVNDRLLCAVMHNTVQLHLCLVLQVLFYCHHPDLLLTQRRSRAHSLYRAPLDFAEQATTGKADKLLVNSLYTQGTLGSHTHDSIGMHFCALQMHCRLP